MQIVLLLAECGLSGPVDEKLQCALGVYPCTPVGTHQLSKVFPVLSVKFPMLDQSGSLVTDAGLAAATGETLPAKWHHCCHGTILHFQGRPVGVNRAQEEV